VLHTLISHGISLFSAHTNADHANPGVSDALAALLGLTDLRPLAPSEVGSPVGTGRVGVLPSEMTVSAFAAVVADALPATHHGVRVAGDLDSPVRSVAVCGGSGGDLLDAAAATADAYVTADLRHHRAQDHLVDGGCALIDVAHWASEWPWLPVAADALRADLAGIGSTVEIHVSTVPTDPWTLHLRSPH
jgi:putative NIF3 family GTP cyclohydrolase 1 type 2